MSNLLILGAGGQGKVVAEIAGLMGQWERIAFLDDREDLREVMGIPVIGKLSDYASCRDQFPSAFVAIGNNPLRIKWMESLLDEGFELPALVHPSSVISKSSELGAGTVVMAGAVINPDSRIGKGCIINTSSSIDHDCVLSNGVHISPGVHLGGTVHIGSLTWICIGSSVTNNVTIGSKSIVAAGAIVLDNIPESVMVAGVPAKKIKDLN
jgi:sugar O-acyltransferase (sialic acid O-acetyltransferase NeuD family)